GKRLVVVDDSIVRGNTQRAQVRMLREAGALEIHVRISSPPVQWPCFYGIDFATRAELIATGLGVEEIRASIGADSLGYISEEGMIGATGQPASQLCTACFTGTYPIELPEDGRIGKHVLETLPISVRTGHDTDLHLEGDLDLTRDHALSRGLARVDGPTRSDADGVPVGVAGGAENALLHP
ncbi:MAG: amidophosphoribosyltransferase, partial [Lapillicoccus sp.]